MADNIQLTRKSTRLLEDERKDFFRIWLRPLNLFSRYHWGGFHLTENSKLVNSRLLTPTLNSCHRLQRCLSGQIRMFAHWNMELSQSSRNTKSSKTNTKTQVMNIIWLLSSTYYRSQMTTKTSTGR